MPLPSSVADLGPYEPCKEIRARGSLADVVSVETFAGELC